MLEKMFTTKMSMDKKSLQQRFSKIRSKNGKTSKLIAVIICFLIIAIIAASAIYVAVKKSNENQYAMSDDEFLAFTRLPIGSDMAEIDYADENKVVFHYGNGFFITDEEAKEIKYKIDLNKLNISIQSQGDTGLGVHISKNGKYAYLLSYGKDADTFDEYVINLNNGSVAKGKMPQNTELFDDYMDTYTMDTIEGWNSIRAVKNDDKIYYLNLPYGEVGNIQLVTIDNNKSVPVNTRYIFGDKFISETAKREKLIHNALPEDYKISLNSGISCTVNGETAKKILKLLEPNIKEQIIDTFSNNSYEVLIYKLYDKKENGLDGLFIFDNTTGKLMYHLTGTNLENDVFPHINHLLDNIDKEFELSDLSEALDITLVIGGNRYSPINSEAIATIKKTLSSAEKIKMGGTACPFEASLIIVNKDKETSKIDIATDSCAVFKAGNTYYDYSDGDNKEFYSLFGIDNRELLNLT